MNMPNPTPAEIKDFLHDQSEAWNKVDREKFFELYRAIAPKSLTIEYVGQPIKDGWAVLEGMWTGQAGKVQAEEIASIVNGSEAANYVHNHVVGTDKIIKTIEIYSFGEGTLAVRYFIGASA
jgi:hypothetical protein